MSSVLLRGSPQNITVSKQLLQNPDKVEKGEGGCSGELRSFIFYALSFRLNGNAFSVCAQSAADRVPLAVGWAKLNL